MSVMETRIGLAPIWLETGPLTIVPFGEEHLTERYVWVNAARETVEAAD